MIHGNRRVRGIVLLLVLGVLGLMSVLAISFVSLSQLERNISINYVNQTRAHLAAESGMEYASSRLVEFAGTVPDAAMFEALQYEEGPEPGLAAASRVSFAMADDSAHSGSVGSTYAPGGDAFRLKVSCEDGKLNINDTNGKWNLDSETDPDDPESDPDILDAPGRLSMLVETLVDILFPGSPGLGAVVSYDLFLARSMLPGDRFTQISQVRDALVEGDPSGGASPALTEEQFRVFEKHITLWSWQDPDTLRPNYQCKISVPVESLHRPIPYDPSYVPRAGNEPKHDWRNDMFLWLDYQTKAFEIEPRCPVNVNLASPELLQALIAPLQGWYLRDGPGNPMTLDFRSTFEHSYLTAGTLGGSGTRAFQYYWADIDHVQHTQRVISLTSIILHDMEYRDVTPSRLGQVFQTPALSMIESDLPRRIAQALFDRIHGLGGEDPNPVETWQEMDMALDDILNTLLPDSTPELELFWEPWNPEPRPYRMDVRWGAWWQNINGLTGMGDTTIDRPYWRRWCREVLRDLLLAQFNPNSQLNDFNPDRHIRRHIDKTQLTQYTTELVFQSTGTFRVECMGEILDENGMTVARSSIQAGLEIAVPLRLTTQAQFMKGMTDTQSYTASSQIGLTAWNARVLSYPEPMLESGTRIRNPDYRYVRDCFADGYLMPSTWEESTSVSPPTPKTFYCAFDGRLTPAYAASGLTEMFVSGNEAGIWQQIAQPPGGYSILEIEGLPRYTPRNLLFSNYSPNHGKPLALTYATSAQYPIPGNLLPDGAMSDVTRGLAYRTSKAGVAALNVGTDSCRKGAVEFWCKPNFDPSCTSRTRTLFDLSSTATVSGASDFGLHFVPHHGYDAYYDPDGGTYPEIPDSIMSQGPTAVAVNSFMFSYLQSLSKGEAHVHTPTVTHEYPGQFPALRQGHQSYHFETHQWSHFVLGWDYTLAGFQPGSSHDVTRRLVLINGKNPLIDLGSNTYCVLGSPPYSSTYMAHPNEWVRFGGLAAWGRLNRVADCTFDEISIYKDIQSIPAHAYTRCAVNGRYYSPASVDPANPVQLAYYQSPKIDIEGQGLRNRSVEVLRVAWTAYWPKFNERREYRFSEEGVEENPALRPFDVNDGERPDPLAGLLGWESDFDPVSVDVARSTSTGDEWVADTNGNGDKFDDHENTFTYAGGSAIRYAVNGKPLRLNGEDRLRFRVYFNQAPGQVVYEAPVFDDITFFLRSNRVFYWEVLHD